MPGITLQQLIDWMTTRPSFELEGLAVEFLQAFNIDEPLQQSDLEEWMDNNERDRYPRDIICAVQEAARLGWVIDGSDGLRLTDEGKKKIRAVIRASSENCADAKGISQ
jgi:hypothetical protein